MERFFFLPDDPVDLLSGKEFSLAYAGAKGNHL